RRKFAPEDEIRSFLQKVFEAMELPVELAITRDEEEENAYDVEMTGEDMGVLIGKRGQTLDALQYLTNLAVNKRLDTYVKIKLDTEDYRRRRKETLENLAKNIAGKVKRTGKDVELEPMNPYERRVIHFALQGDKYVTTHSEGEGPERHVVVTMRDDAPEYRDSRSRNRSGGYRGSKGSGNYGDSKDDAEDANAGTAENAGEADTPTDE
ncbi:MAG: protein jag, partial [Oscillospiraceae bacterium]|nr:protein jag [Oscillospiraceae bacterium]